MCTHATDCWALKRHASKHYEHIARPLQLKQSRNLRITLAAAAAVPALLLPPFLAHIRLPHTAQRGPAGYLGSRWLLGWQ